MWSGREIGIKIEDAVSIVEERAVINAWGWPRFGRILQLGFCLKEKEGRGPDRGRFVSALIFAIFAACELKCGATEKGKRF